MMLRLYLCHLAAAQAMNLKLLRFLNELSEYYAMTQTLFKRL